MIVLLLAGVEEGVEVSIGVDWWLGSVADGMSRRRVVVVESREGLGNAAAALHAAHAAWWAPWRAAL